MELSYREEKEQYRFNTLAGDQFRLIFSNSTEIINYCVPAERTWADDAVWDTNKLKSAVGTINSQCTIIVPGARWKLKEYQEAAFPILQASFYGAQRSFTYRWRLAWQEMLKMFERLQNGLFRPQELSEVPDLFQTTRVVAERCALLRRSEIELANLWACQRGRHGLV